MGPRGRGAGCAPRSSRSVDGWIDRRRAHRASPFSRRFVTPSSGSAIGLPGKVPGHRSGTVPDSHRLRDHSDELYEDVLRPYQTAVALTRRSGRRTDSQCPRGTDGMGPFSHPAGELDHLERDLVADHHLVGRCDRPEAEAVAIARLAGGSSPRGVDPVEFAHPVGARPSPPPMSAGIGSNTPMARVSRDRVGLHPRRRSCLVVARACGPRG